jgi:hypothetical protein
MAYAQARMQARFGARPPEATWQALSAITAFRGFLEQARATALQSWLHNLSPIATRDDIERLLRVNLCARIEEVARWLPPAQRPALRWTGILVDLPAIAHLLRGGEPQAWMRDEPALKSLAAVDAAQRAATLAQGDTAPLMRVAKEDSLPDRWLGEWRRRLPRLPARERDHLERLVRLVRALLAQSAARSVDGQWAHDSAEPRRALEARLAFEFRRRFLEPAAAYACLLLAASEFTRIRGALLGRLVFAENVRP